MKPSLISAVLACLLVAVMELAYNGQAITDDVLTHNASLLTDLQAPPAAEVPHDVTITDHAVSSDGHLYLMIDRTFPHKIANVCEPEKAAIAWRSPDTVTAERALLTWFVTSNTTDTAMALKVAHSPPARSGQGLSS